MNQNPEWNLSALLKNDDDEKAETQLKESQSQVEKFEKKWKANKEWLENPQVLKTALDEYESLMTSIGLGAGDAQYYFWLRSQQDQNSPEIKSKYNKFDEAGKENSNKLIFLTRELSKIPETVQKIFLSSKELEEYKHFLENSFKWKKHLLGEEEEKILALKESVSHDNWEKMVSGLLSKEEREINSEKKNFSEIMSLISDKDKKTRDSAAKALNGILKKYSDIAESEINSILQNKKLNDKLRNFSSPEESRFLNDDIEKETVTALSEAVSSHFSIAKEFYALKAKLLGLKKLEYHERNVPYGKTEKEYSFEDSANLVKKVFLSLDSEFTEIFENFLKEGRIDVFPRKGKRSGAFCVWVSKSKPIYVMLNHTNKLRDITTFAHEFGHAINGELSKKQNELQFHATTSTTEVASTFMEDFVLEEILKHADDELKLSILMEKLNDDISTIFRQIACFKFEQELHSEFREKNYLSKEEIGKIFRKNMEAYMGEAVEQSPGSENWWLHWSHIRSFFYTYTYSFGLLTSKSLQNKVKSNPRFIKKVKEFLAAGSSRSPKEIFSNLGIDITKKEFWISGIEETKALLEETKALAKKLNKI